MRSKNNILLITCAVLIVVGLLILNGRTKDLHENDEESESVVVEKSQEIPEVSSVMPSGSNIIDTGETDDPDTDLLNHVTLVPYSWSNDNNKSFNSSTGKNRVRTWNNDVYGGLIKLEPEKIYTICLNSDQNIDFQMGYLLFGREDGSDYVEQASEYNSGWMELKAGKNYYEMSIYPDEDHYYLGINFANENRDELTNEEIQQLNVLFSGMRLEQR